ncbi:MAG: hypothetical protein AABW67_03950 [Nanoarchaeota archaeon]
MSRKRLQKYIKTLRTKSGVGKYHSEKHCHVGTLEKKQKYAGRIIPCDVVNGLVQISSTGECLRVDCAHAQ